MKANKRILSLAVAAMLLFTMLPNLTAYAAEEQKPDQPTVASTDVSAAIDTNGHAAVTITDSMVSGLIDKAREQAKTGGTTANGIGIQVNVLFGGAAKSIAVTAPANAIDRLNSEGVKLFAIVSPLVNFSFDAAAIKEINTQATGNVTITAEPEDKLSYTAKRYIGSRPVYGVSVSYQKSGVTSYITDLKDGTVTLGFAYTPKSSEKTGSLYAVYAPGNGKPELLTESSYTDGRVLFTSNTLSVYGVGYKTPVPAFTDTANHWAKDNIDFTVSRGLFSGTRNTAFSPDTAVTRGMFITALGRLSGADMSGYTKSSFSDVASGSYYRPYIEWAVENNIVSSVGNGKFAPGKTITREEIAVMMANYAEATGYDLPVVREAVTFADSASISAYAVDAVKALQQAGVVSGVGNNRFNPKGTATRAEAATILRNFVELVIDTGTARGWSQDDAGQRMYYNQSGKKVTGWLTTSDGSKYYFDVSGVMQAGKWVEVSGSRYYFNTSGRLAVSVSHSPTSSTTGSVTVTVTAEGNSGVSFIGWRSSSNGTSYTGKDGFTEITKTGKFTASSNGWYAVGIVDSTGNFSHTLMQIPNITTSSGGSSGGGNGGSSAAYNIELDRSGTYTFPGATVGYAAQTPLTVTVTNTGNRQISGLSATFDSVNHNNFTLSALGTATLAAGGNTTFTVTPNVGLSVGTYEAIVTVAGSNNTSASLTVNFTVSAAPTYTITHDVTGNAHIFTGATVGYTAQTPLDVTITNTGSGDLTGSTIALTTGTAFDLSKRALGAITSGATDTFTVTPKPGLAAGTYTDTVTVTGAPGGETATFTVSFAVSAAPTYTITHDVSGNAHIFTGATVGYTAQTPLDVTITNTGSGDLTGSTIALTTGTAFDLSKRALGAITSGATDTFTVTPKPGLAADTYTDTVTVTGVPGGETATFTVSLAVSAAPTYNITHDVPGNAYIFTGATVGYAAQTPLDVIITNTGSGDLTGGTIALTTGTAFDLSEEALGAITSGATDTFTVTPKTGLATGTYTDTVTVTGVPGGETATFTVSFTVSVAPTYNITHDVPGNAHTFTGVTEGYGDQASQALTVTITNTGSGDLTGGSIALTTGTVFDLSKGALGTITSGETDIFIVTPKTGLATGTYTDTVTVTGAPGGETTTFTVSFAVSAAPTYNITHDVSGNAYIFTGATVGYAVQTPLDVIITNTGSGDLTGGTIALTTGTAFDLSKGALDAIVSGSTDTFTVIPKTGLLADTYTDTVIVTGAPDGETATFTVSFTVSATPTHTVTYNSNGGTEVNPTTQTVNSGATVGSLPTDPMRVNYDFVCWNTAANGKGTVFTDTTTVTGDITVYAMWLGANTDYLVEISAQAQLQAIGANSDNLSKHYKLIDDITLTDAWTPIGDNTTQFTGSFDGDGNTIDGVTIVSNSYGNANAGLFGYIGSGGEVKDLTLVNVNIDVECTATINAGGVVGWNFGTIENCHVTGTVTTKTSSSHAFAGGIEGFNNGGSVNNCSATGTMTATATSGNAYAGGITGRSYSGGSVANCYASGDVTATARRNSARAGGISGENAISSVTNCYATGTVTATETSGNAYAGGVTGISGGSVANCYASGDVTATATSSLVYAGGVAGANGSGGSINNCYATGDVTATSNLSAFAGGVSGDNARGGSIINCAALNSSVQASGGSLYTGRVVGESAVTNCYANSAMTVVNNIVSDGGNNGTGVGSTAISDQSWWSTTPLTWDFTNAWHWESGYLPYLNDSHKISISSLNLNTTRMLLPQTATLTLCTSGNGAASHDGEYGDTFLIGTEVTITATPDAGYVFVEWQDETGEAVSTDAEYSFEITGDVTLTAVFTLAEESQAETPPTEMPEGEDEQQQDSDTGGDAIVPNDPASEPPKPDNESEDEDDADAEGGGLEGES